MPPPHNIYRGWPPEDSPFSNCPHLQFIIGEVNDMLVFSIYSFQLEIVEDTRDYRCWNKTPIKLRLSTMAWD